jgi:hypothetical protein
MMHPAFTMISDRFTGRSGQVYRTVILGLILVFTAFVLVGGALYVYRFRIRRRRSSYLRACSIPRPDHVRPDAGGDSQAAQDTWFPAKEGSL